MSRYKVISVRSSITPAGAQDDNWYCYIIASEHNTIIGYRPGPEHEVKKIAEDCACHMNDKYSGKVRHEYSRLAFPNVLPFS